MSPMNKVTPGKGLSGAKIAAQSRIRQPRGVELRRESMPCCPATMKRSDQHEADLAIAHKNAEAIVRASGETFRISKEDYCRGIQVIGRHDDSPIRVEFYVDEKAARTDRYWDVPVEIAIVIAEWVAQPKRQPK